MRQYNNILVIIEPKRDQQLALERAIQIARFNPKVTITALRLIYNSPRLKLTVRLLIP